MLTHRAQHPIAADLSHMRRANLPIGHTTVTTSEHRQPPDPDTAQEAAAAALALVERSTDPRYTPWFYDAVLRASLSLDDIDSPAHISAARQALIGAGWVSSTHPGYDRDRGVRADVTVWYPADEAPKPAAVSCNADAVLILDLRFQETSEACEIHRDAPVNATERQIRDHRAICRSCRLAYFDARQRWHLVATAPAGASLHLLCT